MPRKPDPKNAYLELHDSYYRVSMGVPAPLHQHLGKRLKKALGTKSLLSANVLKVPIVRDFHARIAKAWEVQGGNKGSVLQEAVGWAQTLATAGKPGDNAYDFYSKDIAERRAEIEMTNARTIRYFDEEEGWVEVDLPSPEAKEAAALFSSVVHGTATPITLHHDAYMQTLVIKDRSKTDDPRALKILLDWCHQKDIPPYLENIDQLTAVRFMDEMPRFTGLSWATNAKYLGRLGHFWKWMLLRMKVKTNPFQGLALPRPSVVHGEEERAFTDTEVQRLLMGTQDPAMLDVMMVAALTGARLDAVIDLRVGDSADGWFTFKPQKKEGRARDVPIHPDLREIVARRANRHRPEDEFFPEWPGPKNPKSLRERSSTYSKHFTRYRKTVGVSDEVLGKRRSLVNFHSFRRWFITKAERAGSSGDLIAAIVGHKRSGLTLGRYSEGPDMKAAEAAVAKVMLPPLDGSPVRETQALTPRRRKIATV
ncbi:tyrosine-type recombinase/integrase [Methylobacterium sp. V23]|uniref:tyrosine-type recombinase/integrase n=1 Tax=Methylobacterium sp. V23 TaxID=2044878 RepID=UPI000CDB05A6|nr:tyrosine-type recombinase/integrase [Methylobacterium sp. V23]POR42368.1 integrase [Methylobacterium sp. V23]